MEFQCVKKLIDDALEKEHIPCSDIIISLKGQTIYRYWNGTRDLNKRIPINGTELYYLYSATKPITCAAALQLYEKGLIDLEDEVSKYIPEYRHMMVKTDTGIANAKNSLKIKHLFTMTSGLSYEWNIPSICKQMEEKPDSTTMEMVKAMAGKTLEFEPGSHFLYGLSHDVLAAVIEVASGMLYGDYIKKNIFDVCGMNHTYVGCPEDVKDKMCCQYSYDSIKKEIVLIDKNNQFILTPEYQSGGAGIVSCVDDYIQFANALVNGEKLLKQSTVDLMRQGHLCEDAYEDFQNCKQGYSYGLGVRTNIDGNFSARGEFGWDGAAGAYAMMDPDNCIAIFYATHVKNYGEYFFKELHPALRDAVYCELGLREKI